MRHLFTLALLLATGVVAARDLFVVVHAREVEVIAYRCENPDDRLGEAPLQRVVITHPGWVDWHVVGGLAPYTLLAQERDVLGNICVTVMDAAGNMATGCAIMDVKVDVRYVTCPRTPEPLTQQAPPVIGERLRTAPPELRTSNPPGPRTVRPVDPVSRGGQGTTPTVTHYGTRSRGEGGNSGGGGPVVTPGQAPVKR